tara:strand:+ start:38 stop:1291 length:1254 start_codon:yes stop_codon:yes gene_type:complete
MTVASGGAGDITLGTAVAGYQTFADAGISDTDILRYTIEDGDDWEIGTGVYTSSGTTLVRTVTESSNSDAAITCSADAVIFVTMAAEDFSGNAVPMWVTEPPTSLRLNYDGTTAVTLTGLAVDESFFPITYSWDGHSGSTVYSDTSLPPQLVSAPTINQSTGEVSLIGSSNTSNFGNFNFRMKASDGVKTQTATTAVELKSFPPTNMTAWFDMDDIVDNGFGATMFMNDKSGLAVPIGNASGSSYLNSTTRFGLPTYYAQNNARFLTISGDYGSGTGGQIGTTVIISQEIHTSGQFAASQDSTFIMFHNWTGLAVHYTYSGPSNQLLRINKVDCGDPSAAASGAAFVAAFDRTKMNSVAYTGWMPTASNYLKLPRQSSSSNEQYIRAVLLFDKTLTNAEVDLIHDYYAAIYGTDMAS